MHAHQFCCLLLLFAAMISRPSSTFAESPTPLHRYVQQQDDAWQWNVAREEQSDRFQVTLLQMTSQKWRQHPWDHSLLVVRPPQVSHSDIALLWISGDGDGTRYLDVLKRLSSAAQAPVAILSNVPNQPLYDGRKEDALIAHTFQQFMKTEDETWPLLFPMVKSAVRAMDTLQAFSKERDQPQPSRFLVTGASKRGWTTWLTAAVDPRVAAMAPMVIDMLNMREQLIWAREAWGRQSDQIADYTELRLHEQMDHPRMVRLRSWVDPYSFISNYNMPKLVLLGLNDPYWVVDAHRHYWDALPQPKLLQQSPNAGHGLDEGRDAIPTLSAFFSSIAAGKPLPSMTWNFQVPNDRTAPAQVQVSVDQKPIRALLWSASSPDRDFRPRQWVSKVIDWKETSHGADMTASIPTPEDGYRAFVVEIQLEGPNQAPYTLSTEARVTPATLPFEQETTAASQ